MANAVRELLQVENQLFKLGIRIVQSEFCAFSFRQVGYNDGITIHLLPFHGRQGNLDRVARTVLATQLKLGFDTPMPGAQQISRAALVIRHEEFQPGGADHLFQGPAHEVGEPRVGIEHGAVRLDEQAALVHFLD